MSATNISAKECVYTILLTGAIVIFYSTFCCGLSYALLAGFIIVSSFALFPNYAGKRIQAISQDTNWKIVFAVFLVATIVVLWDLSGGDRIILPYGTSKDDAIPCRNLYRVLIISLMTVLYWMISRWLSSWMSHNWKYDFGMDRYITTPSKRKVHQHDDQDAEKNKAEEELGSSIAQTVKHARALYFIHVTLFAYGIATLFGIRDDVYYTDGVVELPLLGVSVGIKAFFYLMPIFVIFFGVYYQVYIGYLNKLLLKYEYLYPDKDIDKPYPWIGVFAARQKGAYQSLVAVLFGAVIWWASPLIVFVYWGNLLFLRSSVYDWLKFKPDYHHVIASQPVGLMALVYLAIILICIGVRWTILSEQAKIYEIGLEPSCPISCAKKHWEVVSAVIFCLMAVGVVFQWDLLDSLVGHAGLHHSCLSTPADREHGKGVAGADLQGINLTQADLRGAFLQGANLQGAILEGARLQKANLVGAQMKKAEMMGADLWAAHLEGAELQSAHLEGANLWDARLDAACLGMEEHALAAFNKSQFNSQPIGKIKNLQTYPGLSHYYLDKVNAGLDWWKATTTEYRSFGDDDGDYRSLCDNSPAASLVGAQLGQASLKRATLGCADFRYANLYKTTFAQNRLKHYHYDRHFEEINRDWPAAFEGAFYSHPGNYQPTDASPEEMDGRIKEWIENGSKDDGETTYTFEFDRNSSIRHQSDQAENHKWLTETRPGCLKKKLEPERWKRLCELDPRGLELKEACKTSSALICP